MEYSECKRRCAKGAESVLVDESLGMQIDQLGGRVIRKYTLFSRESLLNPETDKCAINPRELWSELK